MNSIQLILLVVTVLLGYPIGRFIASNTKEELKAGKIWFKLIMWACIFGMIISIIMFKKDDLLSLLMSFAFIYIIAFVSLCYKEKK